MTTSHDDITLLSAYLDGELPEDQANALTERLAREPELMRQLEAMRASDAATRRVFESIDEQPMPQSVLELLGADKQGTTADVVPFPRRFIDRFAQVPIAIAASVALVVGFLVSDVLNEAPGTALDIGSGGIVAQGTALDEFLDTGLSGEARTLAAGTDGELVLTFEDREGRYCRQFAVGATGQRVLHAVACQQDAAWTFEAIGFGEAREAGGAYVTAEDTPSTVNAAVDALIGARDPLSQDEEKSLISNSWKESAE